MNSVYKIATGGRVPYDTMGYTITNGKIITLNPLIQGQTLSVDEKIFAEVLFLYGDKYYPYPVMDVKEVSKKTTFLDILSV